MHVSLRSLFQFCTMNTCPRISLYDALLVVPGSNNFLLFFSFWKFPTSRVSIAVEWRIAASRMYHEMPRPLRAVIATANKLIKAEPCFKKIHDFSAHLMPT